MSLIINNEQLIDEVKKRPILYAKHLKSYDNRESRLKLWTQICQKVVPAWNEMSQAERLLRRKEIQARWANLRYCFWRDYNSQRIEKLKHTPNKKRRWLFFKHLLFLLTPEQKELINYTDHDCDPINKMNIEEHNNNIEYIDSPSLKTTQTITTTTKTIGTMTINEITKESNMFELINEIKEKLTKHEGIDEEKMFLLSLLPIMKKLNDEQKHIAKIEILNLLRRVQLLQYSTTKTTDQLL